MHLGYLHQSLILFILMEVLSGYEERERERGYYSVDSVLL